MWRALAWSTALTVGCTGLVACSSGGKPAATTSPPGASPTTTAAPASTGGASTSAAPTSGAPGPATSGAAAPWPTYNRTTDRNGLGAGVARPTSLASTWSRAVDGAIYGQPIVVGTTVIAATEHDSVYAFDLASGQLRWRTNLGTPVSGSDLPCGNISPLGITGTPAYDPATSSVFVAAETTGGVHDLVAVDAATGHVRWRTNLDVGGHNRIAEQQRGALAVANGRVYVPFGGLYGDCGDYVGYVTATPTSGTGTTAHYAVPTAREGGIWASSGPAVAQDGSVYVAVGNGASTGGPYDGSDSVLRLAPDLSSRIDFFAPSAWAEQNASDTDLGSTGPLLVQGGLVVQSGKDGDVYVLDASHLGGIGDAKAHAGGCSGFGGMAADGGAVFVPCTSGVRRFDVTATSITPGWRASVTGPPTVGGGAVWSLDTERGVLYAFDEATGKVLASEHVGGVTRFTAPVLVGSTVLVGTRAAVVAMRIVPG
jgi:outer membrane protein assembly factor BamB